MLEFIVIVEVIKMISDFVEKRKLRLRFAIDIFRIMASKYSPSNIQKLKKRAK